MDSIQTIQNLTKDLLSKLNIQADVNVFTDETGAYRVHIETKETGLLIGYHGRTLESFQMLLAIMVSRQMGMWLKVYVNVGDYREKREETLHYMAQKAASEAMETGKPVELVHLSPSERRVIHLALSGDDRVTTESFGEGNDRILRVIPSSKE